MTAEIAVLNRSAVALATDSAVTIGKGTKAKTYTSENKLFELSETKPIGLMIYNSMDFYGYPWELIIKDFRKAKGDKEYEYVSGWSQAFVDWLNEHYMPDEIQQKKQLANNVIDFLSEPARGVRNATQPFVGEPKTKLLQAKIQSILPGVMREETRKLVDYLSISDVSKLKAANPNHAPILDETTLSVWLEDQASLIDDKAEEVFGAHPLSDNDKKILRRYVLARLSKHLDTNACTGLVVAGFGEKDKFPSLHHITIDGVYGGKLRCLESEYYDVDRNDYRGTVLAYAQPDVAHRFLYGVDGDLEKGIARYFAKAIEDLVPTISENLKFGPKNRKLLRETLVTAADTIAHRYWKEASEEFRNEFFWDIEDMVRLMPKQEMASLAEALVNITILKRRASAGLETVGGPIDVAIISRHEGFVWVKRKHYFNSRLNPRYFWRKFGGRISEDEAN